MTRPSLLCVFLLLAAFAPTFAEAREAATSKGVADNDSSAGSVTAEGYVIELERPDADDLRVVVRLPTDTHEVAVANWGGADHLPASWSTFVRDLRAVDGDGLEVRVESTGQHGRWRLPKDARQPISLSYRVDLAYTAPGWPVGQEQAGWRSSTVLYSVTRPLFVGPDEWKDIAVRVDVPEPWSAHAPWPEAGSPGVFLVPGVDELRNNAVVLGTPSVSTADHAQLSVRMILLDEDADAAEILRVFDVVLAQYVKIFPETSRDIYQLTVMGSDVNDGEGFRNGATFTLDHPLRESSLVGWADLLAHEMSHYWNGRQVRAADRPGHRWFSEGFTEFISNRSLVRAGILPSSYMLTKIEKNAGLYALYLHYRDDSSIGLSAAGQFAGLERLAVYNGGWLLAMCSDSIIREDTRGAHGVEELLGALYARFASGGHRFTAAELGEVAREVGGAELVGLIETHVAGNEAIDLPTCLRRVGLGLVVSGYSGEAWIYRLDDTDDQQLEAQRALLAGSPVDQTEQ
jgi:predicted metalloprotease with PDZ domain